MMAETSKIAQVLKEVQNLNKVILGNGDPEKGMVVRLIRIEDKIDSHLKGCDEERKAAAKTVVEEFYKNHPLPSTSNKIIWGVTPELRTKIWMWFIRVGIAFIIGKESINKFL